jgi:hypothetical protein
MREKISYIGVAILSVVLFVPPLFAQSHTEVPNPTIIAKIIRAPGSEVRVDRNYEAITNVPQEVADIIQQQPNLNCGNQTSKVWVAHNYRYIDEVVTDFTTNALLNPTNKIAHVSCKYFNNDGSRNLDHGSTFSISPGAKEACVTSNVNIQGWVLIISDQPIFPFGWNVRNSELHYYPIDCTDPTGLEFICKFVEIDMY